jgi:hypothetical protein
MNDRFNATTGSSARRSEVHPGTEGHRIGGSHQGPAISKRTQIASMSNHTTYTLAGMTCGSCAIKVTEASVQ